MFISQERHLQISISYRLFIVSILTQSSKDNRVHYLNMICTKIITTIFCENCHQCFLSKIEMMRGRRFRLHHLKFNFSSASRLKVHIFFLFFIQIQNFLRITRSKILVTHVSGWPSGLRRQTQAMLTRVRGPSVLVSIWRRGFESRF